MPKVNSIGSKTALPSRAQSLYIRYITQLAKQLFKQKPYQSDKAMLPVSLGIDKAEAKFPIPLVPPAPVGLGNLFGGRWVPPH